MDDAYQALSQDHLRLRSDCSYFCNHLGYVKALLADKTECPRIIGGSRLGRILLLANTEVVNALTLFVCRLWDHPKKERVTFYRISKFVPSEQTLETWHQMHMEQMSVHYEMEPVFKARRRFIDADRVLKKAASKEKLRNLRNQVLAHTLDTRKAERPVYDELVEFAESSLKAVEDFGYMLDKSDCGFQDKVSLSQNETTDYLRSMPTMKDVERELSKLEHR